MKKILVCDDAESILEVLEIILIESGYEVKLITESTDIINIIKDFKPDLLLLDLWMKNSDGRDVAKRINQEFEAPKKSKTKIKTEAEIKKFPIFFISALNELDQIATDANVQGFIRKPFEIDDLLTKVEGALAENTKVLDK